MFPSSRVYNPDVRDACECKASEACEGVMYM